MEFLGQDPPFTEVLGQFPDLFRLGDLRHIILGELVNSIIGVTLVITITRSTISDNLGFMGTGVTLEIILIVESRSVSCIRRWEGWCDQVSMAGVTFRRNFLFFLVTCLEPSHMVIIMFAILYNDSCFVPLFQSFAILVLDVNMIN